MNKEELERLMALADYLEECCDIDGPEFGHSAEDVKRVEIAKSDLRALQAEVERLRDDLSCSNAVRDQYYEKTKKIGETLDAQDNRISELLAINAQEFDRAEKAEAENERMRKAAAAAFVLEIETKANELAVRTQELNAAEIIRWNAPDLRAVKEGK